MRSDRLLTLLVAFLFVVTGWLTVLTLYVTETARPVADLAVMLIRGPVLSDSLLITCRDIAGQIIGTVILIRFLPERWRRRQPPEV